MHRILLLAAALALGAHGFAQAQMRSNCGAQVAANGWAIQAASGGLFRYRVTLTPTAEVRLRVRFSMQNAVPDGALAQVLTLRPGRSTTIWLGQGSINPPIAAVQSSTTLVCDTRTLS